MTKRLDPHTERKVAVLAGVDPRTVRGHVEGTKELKSTTKARVEDALRELGISTARDA